MSVSLVYCMYQIDDIIAIIAEGEPLLGRKTSDAKSLVYKLPTHVAEDPTSSSSGCVTETCSICMDHLGLGTAVVDKELPCGHVFHEGCLAEWLSRDLSCPLCRTTIAL